MRYQTQMPHIAFLTQMSPDEVRVAITQFSKKYKDDWKQWTNRYQSSLLPESLIASEFGSVLRKWQAARPRPMRRPRREAIHAPPYLEDLLTEAWPHLKDIGNLSVREINTAAPQQINALLALWDIFRNLTSQGKATCVGITKSVLLLTEGRIGPAFDSTVRYRLRIGQPLNGKAWIEDLCSISDDISLFETRNGVRIESLVPTEWAPINVGRVYDMVAGPR
jgi:hypothetical protein